MPGDAAAGGSTGTPTGTTAGTLFFATATITDAYYNPVGNAATGNLFFNTTDPYDVDGATSTLSNGTTNFAVTMYQAGLANVDRLLHSRHLFLFHRDRLGHSDQLRHHQPRPDSAAERSVSAGQSAVLGRHGQTNTGQSVILDRRARRNS